MFPRIPGGSPPPPYQPPPNYTPANENITLPSSSDTPLSTPRLTSLSSPPRSESEDSVTRGEIEVFGHPLAFAPLTLGIQSQARSQSPTITTTPVTISPPLSDAIQLAELSGLPATRNSGRGRPRKTPAQVEVAPTTFEMLFQILQPEKKKSRARGGKVKLEKQEPITIGPIEVPFDIQWDDLLRCIAKELKTTPQCLVVDSFEWHFLRPQTGPWVPLKTEAGMRSMLKQALAKSTARDASSGFVTVRMRPPLAPSTFTSSTLPWEATAGGNRGGMVAPSGDEDELSDDDGVGPQMKKARLGDELENLAQEIADKYPPGICKLHPDKACFHHRNADLHFDLDRARRLVWAQAILKGNATLTKIPLGVSNLFKANQAMKVLKSQASATPTGPEPEPATPNRVQANPYATFPGFYPFPSPVPPPFGYPPGFNPFSVPQMGWAQSANIGPFPHTPTTGPSRSRYSDSDDLRSSSPPIPDCGIHEFCVVHGFGEDIEAGLDRLGFQMGDNLDGVSREDWTAAGFKPLVWSRVMKAYAKYKRNLKSQN
ncbi:hypothetical protein M378DRAFT_179451 [Amanita muscaria Koide BX008]|uniref:Uncharacterized protein n=1 Tax=Amanita muscaria (strain Koide BX008) TaxID=946122 RepID=A0A0C2X2Y8_AMAMK|nr:hypothetical protein M378DRAFT_179451 [Amanita muscaria Koide BX008]